MNSHGKAVGSLLRLLLAGAFVASCGESSSERRGTGAPSDADEGMPRGGMGMGGMMAMMENMPAGIPADELPDPESREAVLVGRYCSQCHGIPNPRRLAAEEWQPTLRRMLVRMERMARMPMHRVAAPSPEEARLILDYLQANALPTAPAGSLPADDPAARLFARACSRCHALPDPAQHTAEAWPAVVERMRENMRRMEVDDLTNPEEREIIVFLQRHARDGF